MRGPAALLCVGLVACLSSACSCRALGEPNRLVAMGKCPDPPAMPKRAIAKPTTAPAGEQVEIVDGDYKPTLFIPEAFQMPADGRVNLIVHFHGGLWFPIQEHLRHGLDVPLLVCQFGEGSSVYGKPFSDPDRFARFISAVEAELARQYPGSKPAVVRIDLTSFSAGYGAVREIVKQDRYVELIRRIVLCDSLYASWDPATTRPGATSRPADANMEPWRKFITLAARGEKTFVLAHSQVPTPYANTAATAQWIVDAVSAPRVDVPRNSTPASSAVDFPLIYRADLGRLHVWGYAGEDAQAHLTSVRHLADLWMALDACGDR
jgi:hypothetical protein